jgi:hypothetical protein
MAKRELVISGILSAFVLVLFSLPFVLDELERRRDLKAFIQDGVGELLSPGDKILDFKCSRTPSGSTTFCRFTASSALGAKLNNHGTLPPPAKDMILVVSQSLNVTPRVLPDSTSDTFHFAPNHKEPQSWLVLYDNESEIGWAFVTN